MSVIGSVSHISGTVIAVKPDGTERVLALGDPIYEDDLIRVSPDASIEIAMNNADPVVLEGGQTWLVSSETFNDSNTLDVAEAATSDIDAIQAAILAGADPTEVGEATAAGGEAPAAGGQGNEGSSTVNISRTAEEVDPNAGYDTVGFQDTFEQPEETLQDIPDVVDEPPSADTVTTEAQFGEVPEGLSNALAELGLTAGEQSSGEEVIINFDDVSSGTDVSNYYPGVTFSSESDSLTFTTNSGSYGSSGPNVGLFLNTGDYAGDPQNAPLYIEFATPVSGLSFNVIGDNLPVAEMVIDVYINGELSETVVFEFDADPTTADYVDLTEFNNITKVVIRDIGDLYGIGYDDFTYTVGEVSDIDVALYKELTVDGVIGDSDITTADFGGADAETSLENLVFTLTSAPNYGSLVLITESGDTSFLTVGDTFASTGTVYWYATSEDLEQFETTPPSVEFNYSVTDESGNVTEAPVVISIADDTPEVAPEAITVDEDGLVSGIAGEEGNGDVEDEVVMVAGNLDIDFGLDGPGNITFSTDITVTGDEGEQPLTSNGNPVTYAWDADTNTLTALANEGEETEYQVFTLEITDLATGAYEFNLLSNVDHPTFNTEESPDIATEDDLVLEIPFTVEDSNGTEVDSVFTLTIDDDSPDARTTQEFDPEAEMTAPDMLLDESDEPDPVENPVANDGIDDGVRSVTGDFSVYFVSDTDPENEIEDVAFGADGPKDEDPLVAVEYSFALTKVDGDDTVAIDEHDEVASGLFTIDATADDGKGEPLYLFLTESGDIEGKTSAESEEVYFTLSVNAETGEVTFTQEVDGDGVPMAVWHPETDLADSDSDDVNADDAVYLDLNAGAQTTYAITLTQKVTDNDDDFDTASVNLVGHEAVADGVFGIEDDGPKAQLVTDVDSDADVTAPDPLVLDESPTTDDGIVSATGDFSVYFVTNDGDDSNGDEIDFGTDGPGSVTYSLSLTDLADGEVLSSGMFALDSGDTDADDGDGYGQGDPINLYESTDLSGNTIIVGKTSADSDTIYFTLSVDDISGVVTFEQSANIWHPTAGDGTGDPTSEYDDSAYLSLMSSLEESGAALSLIQTVEDADGDTDTASIQLLGAEAVATNLFEIQDDGPSAQTLTGNVVSYDTGTDGGTFAWDATQNGDGTITPTDDMGGYTFAWDTNPAQPAANDEPIYQSATFSYTVTDADGDTATASISFSRTIEPLDPDTPVTASASATQVTFNFDETQGTEDRLVDGETSTIAPASDDAGADLGNVSIALSTIFSLSSSGGDDGGNNEDKTYSFTGLTAGVFYESTLQVDGETVYLYQDGNVITGYVGNTTDESGPTGAEALTITLDDDSIDIAQKLAIDHTGTETYDELTYLQLADTADNDGVVIKLTGSITAEDGNYDGVPSNDKDEASADIDLIAVGSTHIAFEDDGPAASLNDAFVAPELIVDESDVVAAEYVGPTLEELEGNEVAYEAALADDANYAVIDDGVDDGIVSATASFAGAFAAVTDFGSDGEGSVSYSLVLTGSDVPSGLFTLRVDGAQGDQILLNEAGGVITGSYGSTDYFTISVNDDGDVTFTQINNIYHGDAADSDDAETLTVSGSTGEGEDAVVNSLVIQQTVTDADGDEATEVFNLGAGVFTIEDDGPLAAELEGVSESLQLDETSFDGSPISTTISATDIEALFDTPDYGTDGEGDVTYTLTANSLDTGLYLTGAEIVEANEIKLVAVLNGDSQIIGYTGYVNGDDTSAAVFSVAINHDTGELTFTQYQTLEHLVYGDDPVTDHNDTLTLDAAGISVTQIVEDADGDISEATSESTLGLTFYDDGPAYLNPTTAHVIDLATTPDVIASLNFDEGNDGFGDVVFSVTYNNQEVATDSNDNPLSYNGLPLYLYTIDDGATIVASTSTTLAGVDPADITTTGYTLTLNDDGTYTFHSNGVINNGTSVSATDLQGVGGGNVVWKGLYGEIDSPDPQGDFALPGTSQDVMLSTATGNTINTNASDIGVGQGNSFTAGEGYRLDFVNDLEVTKVGNVFSFTYDGTHNLTNAFRQEISFAQSNVNITLAAIVADGDNLFYNDSGEAKVALDIENINIYDALGNLMEAGTDYTFTDHGDTITVNGLQHGWEYEIVTDGESEQFSAVQVDAAAGTDEFKLGFFSYGKDQDGSPIELSYDITGTDGDGDSINGTIDVTLYPSESTILGTDSGETIDGTAQIDFILGMDGNDILNGMGGDDILIGGLGNDSLSGGAGNDTFIWAAGDVDGGIDSVTDFSASVISGTDDDVLDLSDLLSDGTNQIIATEVDGHMQLTIAKTSDASVVKQVINLDHVSVTDDTDAETLLTQLLDNHNIDDGSA